MKFDCQGKRLLILGAGEMQLPVIAKAVEMGCYTIVADYNPLAPGFQYADQKLSISTNDVENLIKASSQFKIDGVLTTSDYPVRAVASICDYLGLPGPSYQAAVMCTNKYLLREHLSQQSFLVPLYRIIHNKDFLGDIDFFPCVIKPIDSSGSRGVRRVNSYSELVEAFESAVSYSSNGSVIVEEFIDGSEYSVEALTQFSNTSIVAITEKTVSGDDGIYFVEDRHIIPAHISKEIENNIVNIVTNLILSMDLDNCSTHTELKVTEKGVYIIEIGARLGGDYITSSLVPLATGVDMLSNVIKISLNLKINTIKSFSKFSGVQFINSNNYSRVAQYLKKDNQHIIEKVIKPYMANRLTSSFDRLGHFIVQTNSREQLLKTLDCN